MSDKLRNSKLRLDKSKDKLEKVQSKIPKKKVKQRLYENENSKDKLNFTDSRANSDNNGTVHAKLETILEDKPKLSSEFATNINNPPTRVVTDRLEKTQAETPKKKVNQRLYEKENSKDKLDFTDNRANSNSTVRTKLETVLVDKSKLSSEFSANINNPPTRVATDKTEKTQVETPKKKVNQRLYEKEKPKSKLDFTDHQADSNNNSTVRTKLVTVLGDKSKLSSEFAANINNPSTRVVTDKTEKTQAEAPKKKATQRLYEKEKPKSKLDLTDHQANSDSTVRTKLETGLIDKAKPSSKLATNIKKLPMRAMTGKLHSEVAKNEDDNVGVKSAHSALKGVEFTSNRINSTYHNHKLKPYKNLAKAEKRMVKAEINHTFQKKMTENSTTNPMSKWQQKRAIKKQYAKAYRAGIKSQQTVKEVAKKGVDITVKSVSALVKNPKGLLIIVGAVLVFMLVSSMFSSCSIMFQGGINAIVATSYTSEDEDIIEVDKDYKGLEKELRAEIDNIESDYPDYDEYRYNLDEIGHNPHELASYLTALLQNYKPNEVEEELKRLFDLQYELDFDSEVEIRYRTETRTDSEGNSYTVEVPYEYYILNITLTNTSIKKLAETLLTTEQLERFNVLLEQKGNKPDIFDDIYSESDTGQDTDYEVPAHHLTDEQFGTMLKEAEKYLGYPYVWGGSNPSTSFDCSGFVCWVFNQSGVYDIPRTTAQGIYNQTQPVSKGDAKAGDIIFFEGTYDSAGAVSHVGIYVGDGMMIHCGNPIGYANVNSSYWSDHFYSFGRLPTN